MIQIMETNWEMTVAIAARARQAKAEYENRISTTFSPAPIR